MATYTFDPSSDEPTADQKAAEAAALEQGEKIAQAQEEDRNRKYQQTTDENDLIGGKFKTQDDLLKAYNELQKKLSSGEEPSEEVEAPEGRVDEEVQAEEQQPEEEVGDAEKAIINASKAYEESGELSDESIEALSQLDSKELIKAYLSQFQKQSAAAKAVQTQQADSDAIIASVGGQDQYNTMIQWASDNLSADEIQAYNTATSAGAASAKFAVEALSTRYKAAEGYEAPLVTGKAPRGGPQPYRSNAELARDIADPKYHTDPAFRADVDARLARSSDLL